MRAVTDCLRRGVSGCDISIGDPAVTGMHEENLFGPLSK
jgi:hypothetical protein